jgi:uncharacterized protein (TIGR02246 family)
MRTLLLAALLALACASSSPAQQAPAAPRTASTVAADSATTAALVALFRAELDAFKRRDTTAVAASFAPDARFYGESPQGRTRADVLAEIAQAPAGFAGAELAVDEVRAYRSGDLAVLTCLASFRIPTGTAGTLPNVSRLRVTRVHERRNGRWTVVVHQATPLDETGR